MSLMYTIMLGFDLYYKFVVFCVLEYVSYTGTIILGFKVYYKVCFILCFSVYLSLQR